MTLTVKISISEGQGYGAKICSLQGCNEPGDVALAADTKGFQRFVTDGNGHSCAVIMEHESLQPGESVEIAMWDQKELLIEEIPLK